MTTKVSNTTLLRVAVRAHILMSGWNFQRMQNLGFLYSIMPAFHKLCKIPEKQKDFLERHTQFFNTHPYFASYILGLVIRKEEDLAANTESYSTQAQSIESTKRMFMGPFGALGDSFFWGALRPFLGLTTMIIGILCYSMPKLFWLAPVIFLLLYNIFHEYIRFTGVFVGYQRGEQTIQWIQKLKLQKTISLIQSLGILLAGVFLGLFAFINPIPLVLENISNYSLGTLQWIILCLLTGIFYYGLQKKITTTKLFFTGLGVLLIIDFIHRGLINIWH